MYVFIGLFWKQHLTKLLRVPNLQSCTGWNSARRTSRKGAESWHRDINASWLVHPLITGRRSSQINQKPPLWVLKSADSSFCISGSEGIRRCLRRFPWWFKRWQEARLSLSVTLCFCLDLQAIWIMFPRVPFHLNLLHFEFWPMPSVASHAMLPFHKT